MLGGRVSTISSTISLIRAYYSKAKIIHRKSYPLHIEDLIEAGKPANSYRQSTGVNDPKYNKPILIALLQNLYLSI